MTCAFLASCASSSRPPVAVSSPVPQPALHQATFTSFDGDRFPYHKWLPRNDRSPRLVVVGFHGIAGASSDLSLLGEYLQKHLPHAALYAPDLRGQGNDPISSRKGDIHDRHDWFQDVFTFTRLVQAEHPKARIVWCGESMGSLIALHAVAAARSSGKSPCDGLILSSPIARIHDDFPEWKKTALRWGANLFPRLKLSLESLSGEEEVQVVKGVVHQDQVQTNAYHVSAFTLRLLHTLGTMIESSPQQAARVEVPVLLLHGGHDIFSRPEDVKDFATHFPNKSKVQRSFYPESYHLLFYDHQSERVLTDITTWLRRF